MGPCSGPWPVLTPPRVGVPTHATRRLVLSGVTNDAVLTITLTDVASVGTSLPLVGVTAVKVGVCRSDANRMSGEGGSGEMRRRARFVCLGVWVGRNIRRSPRGATATSGG